MDTKELGMDEAPKKITVLMFTMQLYLQFRELMFLFGTKKFKCSLL